MKTIISILLFLICIPSFADITFDSYPESNQSSEYALYSGSTTHVSQSLATNIPLPYNLKNIQFYIKKTGSPTGNVYAALYFSSSNKPNGTVLATSNAIDVSTLGTSFGVSDFIFATNYQMASSTYFAIVIYYTGGDASNYISVGLDNTSSTGFGIAAYSTNGTTYTTENSKDLIYYVNAPNSEKKWYYHPTNGSINDAANWYTDSTHTVNTLIPQGADTVRFYYGSGTGNASVITAFNCGKIDFTGFRGVFTGGQIVNTYYDIVFYYAINFAGYSGTIFFLGTGTQNFYTNGKSVSFSLVKNSTGSLTFMDNLTMTGSALFGLSAGTLNFNDKTVIFGRFSSSSGTRVLNLTSSVITVNYNSWNSSGAGLTVNAGTSKIYMNVGSFNAGTNNTFNKVYFIGTGITNYLLNASGTVIFNTLKITASNGAVAFFQVSGNWTVSDSLVVDGYSHLWPIQWYSSVTGSTRTWTCNGYIHLQYLMIADVIGAGSVTWSGTRLSDIGNNTNIIFEPQRHLHWVGYSGGNYSNSANWSLTVGGASGELPPLLQDSVTFDAGSITSSGRTIVIDTRQVGRDVNFSALQNSPTVNIANGNAANFTGNFIWGSTVNFTSSSSQGWQVVGRRNQTVTSAGKQFLGFTCDNYGYTLTANDNIQLTAALLFFSGSFNANNNNITASGVTFQTSGGSTLTMGSGVWTLFGSSNCMNVDATTTVVPGTSLISITGTATNNFWSFGGSAKTYYDCEITGSTSTYYFTFGTSMTFHNLTIIPTVPAAMDIRVTGGSTITCANFRANGSSGKLIKMWSTNTTNFVVSQASGNACCDYMNLIYATGSGGATFKAGVNSTIGTNVIGWTATSCPTGDIFWMNEY